MDTRRLAHVRGPDIVATCLCGAERLPHTCQCALAKLYRTSTRIFFMLKITLYALVASLAAPCFARPEYFAVVPFKRADKDHFEMGYLVVGGGGGGGAGGGGGGGGVLMGSLSVSKDTSFSITVGAGGVETWHSPTLADVDGNGKASTLGSLVAHGGGAGATMHRAHGGGPFAVSGTTFRGANGASGGGSGGNSTETGQRLAGGDGMAGQGFAGGASSGRANSPSGGGGGAGGPGQDASYSAGAGGPGLSSAITGTARYYGGGGGGGAYRGAGGLGGLGGGGNGGGWAVHGTAGVNGTGGGGGGNSGVANSGPGGSGVVVIAVPASRPAIQSTCSPAIQLVGTQRVYSFTSGCAIVLK